MIVTFTAVTAGADGVVAASADKVSNGGAKIVKQTGLSLTATCAVAAILVVALVSGIIVVSRKKLLAKR